MSKVELRNIKHAAFASEETNCFQATVYIDGVKAGEVSNDGHGGCNYYHPHTLEARLNEIAKPMPPHTADFDDPKTGKPYVMEMNAELLVHELFTTWLIERDLKRALPKRVIYTRTDKPGVFQTKVLPQESKDRLLAELASPTSTYREKWAVKEVLNTMPFAEAVKIYGSAC